MNSEQATAQVVRLLEEIGIEYMLVGAISSSAYGIARATNDADIDLDDVQNVIAVSGQRFDWDYINEWTTRHGTHELLNEIRASIPDTEFLDDQE